MSHRSRHCASCIARLPYHTRPATPNGEKFYGGGPCGTPQHVPAPQFRRALSPSWPPAHPGALRCVTPAWRFLRGGGRGYAVDLG